MKGKFLNVAILFLMIFVEEKLAKCGEGCSLCEDNICLACSGGDYYLSSKTNSCQKCYRDCKGCEEIGNDVHCIDCIHSYSPIILQGVKKCSKISHKKIWLYLLIIGTTLGGLALLLAYYINKKKSTQSRTKVPDQSKTKQNEIDNGSTSGLIEDQSELDYIGNPVFEIESGNGEKIIDIEQIEIADFDQEF